MNEYFGYTATAREIPNKRYSLVRKYVAESVVADTTITVDTIKEHLRIPLIVTTDDVYLLSLLETARVIFESATGLTILETDWLTYRYDFITRQFLLRKREFKSLTSIQYSNTDDETKTIDHDNYYTTDEYPFSRVIIKDEKAWGDENIKVEKQCVHIRFKAGLSDDQGVYPGDIKFALLAIVASAYVNRGDCQTTDYATTNLPMFANNIIAKYRTLYLSNTNYLEDKHGVWH